jgi:hypothetical protein
VARRSRICRAWWGGWDSNPRPRDYEACCSERCAKPLRHKGLGLFAGAVSPKSCAFGVCSDRRRRTAPSPRVGQMSAYGYR